MKWLSNLDMTKNQIMNAILHLLGTDPAGQEGQIYHNTTTHTPKVHNGSAWLNLLLENRIGAVSGVASLDATGKIPSSQIPSSIANGMDYKTTWDASGGIAPTAGKPGDFWIISVAGTILSVIYKPGDWIVSRDGASVWDKIDNSTAVATVFGRTGAIVSANGDYNTSQITNTPAGNITSTTAQAALNELDTKKEPTITVKNTAFNVGFETVPTNIKMDGVQGVGVANTAARADHVHPTDTTRQAALISASNIKTINGTTLLGAGDLQVGTTLKYSVAIGDGTTTTFTVTHNLNSRAVLVDISENSGSYNQVMADIAKTTLNTITVTFAVAPTTAQYLVTVLG